MRSVGGLGSFEPHLVQQMQAILCLTSIFAYFLFAFFSSKPQRGAVKQRAASPVKPVSRPGPVAAQGPALDLLNFGDSPPKSSESPPAMS